MPTTPLTLRLDPDLKSELEREAKNLDRTPSFLAAKAIEAYLAAKAEKNEAIKAAMAKADEGAFISSNAMHEWMDSWGTDEESTAPKPDLFL